MGIQVILGTCHPSVITFVNHQAHFLLATAAFTFTITVEVITGKSCPTELEENLAGERFLCTLSAPLPNSHHSQLGHPHPQSCFPRHRLVM